QRAAYSSDHGFCEAARAATLERNGSAGTWSVGHERGAVRGTIPARRYVDSAQRPQPSREPGLRRCGRWRGSDSSPGGQNAPVCERVMKNPDLLPKILGADIELG